MSVDVDADRASMRVVAFVAEYRGVDAAALPPLGHAVDADALDRVVDSLDDDEYVRLSYDGLLLYVWGDGEITVEDV